jgi:hypothetical protein
MGPPWDYISSTEQNQIWQNENEASPRQSRKKCSAENVLWAIVNYCDCEWLYQEWSINPIIRSKHRCLVTPINRDTILPLTRINPRYLGHPTSSLVTIPTQLSRLPASTPKRLQHCSHPHDTNTQEQNQYQQWPKYQTKRFLYSVTRKLQTQRIFAFCLLRRSKETQVSMRSLLSLANKVVMYSAVGSTTT